ncbi:uncharacterized MFS-type transporter YhjX-like [Argopecten irradians]|uniref:uncharacterized MFS-type transporter YhjX-like n=1 Tax=Argopecten irradians TaxID=31199 RepID=UPI003722AE37
MADQSFLSRYHTRLKWAGLAVGCLAKFMSGSLFVFNAYEDAIKYTFNFTAKEVQLQSSFLTVGSGLGFLPGMFYDRFGPQWCSMIGLVLSLAAYLLIWSTTKSILYYSSHSWLMAFYFFLSGLGFTFTYVVALNTNVINFPAKHRGKIVGLLSSFFAGSPSIFSSLYYHVIGKDDPKSADSFSSLMLVFAVCFVIVDFLCMVFLRVNLQIEPSSNFIYSNDIQQKAREFSSVNKGFIDENSSTNSTQNIQNREDAVTAISKSHELPCQDGTISLLKILLNVDYQLVTWVISLAGVSSWVYTIALTQTTAALGLASHDADIVLVIPIANAITSFTIGIISDHFRKRLPRLVIILAGVTAFFICQCLTVALADRYAVLVTASVFNGMGQAVVWSIAPALMSEMFSVKNLGRNWGITMLLSSLVGFASQEAFGALYDAQISVPGEVYCYGMSCIRGGQAVALGATVISMILCVILYRRRKLFTK